MSITSIFGIQSGFNTSEVIEKLIALQQRPLEAKVSERELQIERLDLFKQLRQNANSFKSLVRTMDGRDQMTVKVGSFLGNTDTAKVDVITSVTSPSGSFAINVTQLARVGIVRSDDNYASATSVYSPDDAGTLEITVGSTQTDISITDTDTLQDVVDKINASSADVTARVVDSGSGQTPFSIVITGNQTGAENAVSAVFNEPGPDQTFSSTQAAQDALFTLDNIQYARSSNIVDDVIDSTTLTLEAEGSGTIQISISTEEIEDKVEAFVEEYNQILAFIDKNAFFDSDTLESGPLFGSASLRQLKQNLADLVSAKVQGLDGDLDYLSTIGIATRGDGTLELDSAKLSSALSSDPQGVINLFITSGSASHSEVEFVSASEFTEEGEFELRVIGGVPHLRKSGETDFVAAVAGPGNTYIGAQDTSAEGLVFSIDPAELGTDGDKGTLTVSIGIAEKLDRALTASTKESGNSALSADINATTEKIEDLNEVILMLDDRLKLFEDNLRQKFIRLETILGQLNSQREAVQASLANLPGMLKSSK
ncbi:MULTISPECIES: flagellar filament capping protein FliD [unclassified Nitrospina]|uniref:flagellar filament capping protein FliD n=1 Tax=unclassified Nitrospina TaxID=2638683 RepID=UPI003F9D86B4